MCRSQQGIRVIRKKIEILCAAIIRAIRVIRGFNKKFAGHIKLNERTDRRICCRPSYFLDDFLLDVP